MTIKPRPSVVDLETAIELLEIVKMPWTFRPHDRTAPVWDGQQLYIVEPVMSGSDVTHELCHWLVATPECRQIENYDCGMDAVGRGTLDGETQRGHVQDDDEVACCLLDIMLFRWLGLDWFSRSQFYNFGDVPSLWPAFMSHRAQREPLELLRERVHVKTRRKLQGCCTRKAWRP